MTRRWAVTRQAAIGVVLMGAWARPAAGDPQVNAGVTVGAAFAGVVGPSSTVGLHLGGRADVLLLRGRERDMAMGPYVDVATAEFHDVDLGGGAEWLVPLTEDIPLVASAGAFVRSGGGHAWAPGVEGTLFCGSRSYNYHSWYGLAVGAFVQSRWVPESPASLDVVAGVQVDGELFILPVLLAYSALTH